MRKKTLSLNPEEREALENLVEEVILEGGIGNESGSSDDEESGNKTNHFINGHDDHTLGDASIGDSKVRLKTNKKYYPGQLKVALKHMTELPPRSSRKLKKAEKYLEVNLSQQAT